MDDEERKKEEKEVKEEQDAIQTALQDLLNLNDEDILTGWIICYEGMGRDGERRTGHIFGPEAMTIWGALGLLDWTRRVSLMEGNTFNIQEFDDDDEDSS